MYNSYLVLDDSVRILFTSELWVNVNVYLYIPYITNQIIGNQSYQQHVKQNISLSESIDP